MLWRFWVCLGLLLTLFSSWMILQFKLPKDQVVLVERSRISIAGGDYLTLVGWRDDSQILASTNNDGQIQLWDSATGQVLATLEHFQSETQQLAWQPQGTLLAAIAAANPDDPQSKQLALWDSAQLLGPPALVEFDRPLYRIAWRPDGAQLAILTESNLIIWDVVSRTIQQKVPMLCGDAYLSWNSTSTLLAIQSKRTCRRVYVINPSTGGSISTAVNTEQPFTWFDASTLIIPYHHCERCIQGGLSVIEVGFQVIYQGGQLLDLPVVKVVDRVISDSSTGLLFLSPSQDLFILQYKNIYLWRLSDQRYLGDLPYSYASWLPMSPDDTFLPVPDDDITPITYGIFDWQTPGLALVIPRDLGTVSWSPDSQQLAQMVDGVLIFWQRQEVCADWPDPLRDLLVRQRPWCE